MSINYLDTENQDNLLFKQFQGVVQANINTGTALVQYSGEQRKALKNTFNESIFSNNVPKDLSNNYWNVNLDISATVTESTWVGSGASNQTVGQMQNIGTYIIPGTNGDLTFYKQVYLEPVAATNQAWYCRDPSSANPTSFSTDNNLLKDCIPFLYNDGEPSVYTPIMYYNSGTIGTPIWSTQQQNVPNSLNWVFDSASGILQFYQTDAILNGLQIDKTGVDASGNPIEGQRPRFSFIKYTGPKGASGSGGGISDASYNDLVQDICDNYLAIQDLSNNNNLDLNKYFIDIPVAPTDGSGSSVAGVSSIVLTWTNPVQLRAAFDFYQNIADLYSGISGSLADNLQDRMNYVPFHRNLKLQFRAVDPSGTAPPSDWPNLGPSTLYPWTDVSNADIYGSGIVGVLFKDIDSATFSITGVSGEYIQDLSTNEYFNTDGLPHGKVFQFRVAQTNLGYVNGSVPMDNSWNYLYIPDISNEYIQMGEFGPPEAPSDLNFFNMTYESADISGMTLNNADASLNTPFPISYPPLSLSVKYQFDLSGGPFNSVQYPTNLNAAQFDVSFVTFATQQNNFQVDLSYNPQNIDGTWQGTVIPSNIPISQLDVYPEHKYELDGSFCMYNIINGSVVFDPSCVPINKSFVSVRPTRTEANETGQVNSETYFEDQSNQLLFTNSSTTYTVINNAGTPVSNVYFIDSTETLPFILSGTYYTQDNSDNILGIDASGISCSKYVIDCSNSVLLDASANTLGFESIKVPGNGNTVDTSNNNFRITVFNDDIGTGQKKGGYYSYAQIMGTTNFIVSQSRYLDSSNNNYDPYDIRIKQYNNTQQPEQWVPKGEKTFQFLLAHEAAPTTFVFNSLSVDLPSTNRDFFGLNRPITDASIVISFDINGRNLWWRGSTSVYTIMSTTNLFWNKIINTSFVNFDISNNSWSPLVGWSASQSITNTLTISRVNDLGSNIPNANSYCRKGVNSVNNPVNQFKIGLPYANNVPLVSPQTEYSTLGAQPPTDISFGGLLLFWDFTWKGNTSWVSSATLSGTGNSAGGFYPDNPVQFFSAYPHNITLPINQLMWSGEDSTTSTLGAFRNGNHGTNKENPYIDYSGTYFDNLYTYLSQDTTGDTVNISYSKNGSPGDYYADPTVAVTVSEINGVYKWITVKITKSVNDSNIIKIIVDDHDANEMTLGDDYVLFICEASAQFTTSNSPYTGRTGWKDSARKYDTQLGNITQNTNGTGIYINNGNGNLQLFTSNNVLAHLYLRIGLANRNSTTNVNIAQTTSQKSIGGLSWSFL
jgi:hypothetical protein